MTFPLIATPSTPVRHRYSPRTCSVDVNSHVSLTPGSHTKRSSSAHLSPSPISTTPRTPRSGTTEVEGACTPFTPFSGRSSASSLISPHVPSETTGDSVANKQLSSPQHRSPFYTSIQNSNNTKAKNLSLADQIDNWRTRARLNGIKVASDGNECDNSCEISEEKRHQLITARPQLPLCFSTPPPKRNRENIYARGAYTAPMNFPGRYPEISHSNPSSPFACDSVAKQRLLSPIKELEDLATYQSTEESSYSVPFLPTAETDSALSQTASASFGISASSDPGTARFESNCTVCDKHPSESFRMIVLSPCSHVFCSSCFTGTLNIVGEKNMSCMECSTPIKSFHFALDFERKSGSIDSSRPPLGEVVFTKLANLIASQKSVPGNYLPSQQMAIPVESDLTSDISVLRIDNIPWDVTPPMLRAFFKLPLHSVHVLLDPKGKTLSHAFVRLATPNARLALRSTQNAILGKGRRARAVSVTLASLDELLMETYPDWRGTFKDGVPSLDGLDSEKVKEALKHGLVSKERLYALRELMLNPHSPFLKDAKLPFSSLVNILLTFPSDADSQIFWNREIRDILYEVAMDAVKIQAERAMLENTALNLLVELGDAVLNCKIFTELQKLTMLQLVRKSIHSN